MSALPALRRGRCALILLASIFSFACVLPARAAVITYGTPGGSSTGGQPVSAEVTFTTSTNLLQVTLTNKQADPTSAVQCLSGLRFHLSTGQTSGSLTSSSGTDRTVNNDDTYTDGGTVTTGWLLATVASDLMLDDLGGDSPEHTIVGPPNGSNLYPSGNSSIKNGSHNPHLAPTATFSLNVPGVTAASTISSVVFQFNTSAGNNVSGIIVPEPAGLSILGVASLMGLARTRRPAIG